MTLLIDMQIKGIPGHERCTDTHCVVDMGISCLTTDKVYTAVSGDLPDITYSMTLPTALVHEDGNLYSGKYVPSVSIMTDEEINVIQVNAEGRMKYQCPTCSKPWEGEKMFDLVEKEAQKRILEKAIERLESIGKEDRIESELHEAQCVCSICMSWEHRKEAIAELKLLMGEVDT